MGLCTSPPPFTPTSPLLHALASLTLAPSRPASSGHRHYHPNSHDSTISLRPYQQECIDSCLTAFSNGQNRLAVSLATGAGKTVIFSRLTPLVPAHLEHGQKTLIIVHRRELVNQAANHCRLAHPHKTVDIEMGPCRATGKADITVASIQSLIRGDRLLKFDPYDYKLIIIDEAHHAAAQSYLSVLEYFNARNAQSKVKVIGFSATMARNDGLKLAKAMDVIVYHRDFVEMIKEGWLCDVTFTTVKTTTDMNKVKTASTGDYDLTSLSEAVNTIKNNELLIRMWLMNREKHQFHSTLIFCVDINHVESLTDIFRTRGIDARFVTSATKREARDTIIQDFKDKKFPVMINCGVFSEGTDIPNIDCVILNRPTRSKNLLVQMIGRGMRQSEGKINCYVYDFVGSVDSNMITVPTLLGLDPDVIVNDKTMQDLIKQKEQKDITDEEIKQKTDRDLIAEKQAKLEQQYTKVTAKTYKSITDIINNSYDTAHSTNKTSLVQMRLAIYKSRYSWVLVDKNKFVLSIGNGDTLKLEYNNKSFTLSERSTSHGWTRADGLNINIQKKNIIFEGILDAEQAVSAAETYINHNCKSKWSLLKTAESRSSPATPKQVAHIKNFLKKNDEKLDEYKSLELSCTEDNFTTPSTGIRALINKINTNEINKGEAGDLITMFHNGGLTNLIRDSTSLLKRAIQQHKSNEKKLLDQQLREIKKSTKPPTRAERLKMGHDIKVGEIE